MLVILLWVVNNVNLIVTLLFFFWKKRHVFLFDNNQGTQFFNKTIVNNNLFVDSSSASTLSYEQTSELILTQNLSILCLFADCLKLCDIVVLVILWSGLVFLKKTKNDIDINQEDDISICDVCQKVQKK